jgi:hypothetical protein
MTAAFATPMTVLAGLSADAQQAADQKVGESMKPESWQSGLRHGKTAAKIWP